MSANALCGRRILVVEDQYAIALDLAETLAQEGATTVGPLCSLKEALNALETAGPLDAAVLDIRLLGESVYPVADRLDELHVPYIFTTGCEPDEIPERYRFVPRFDKPVRVTSIVEALRGQLTSVRS
jgi:CheY-like chemotaxis protein